MKDLQRQSQKLAGCLPRIDLPLLKLSFAAVAVFMLLAHGFAFFNLFPSHDGTIIYFDADVVMLQLGRWVQLPYYRFLRGKISAPWLCGAFCILWTSLTVYLISALLQLGKKATVALAGLLSTAVSLTLLLATFNDKSDLFTCAMFLACLGVYAVRRCKNKVFGVLFCGGCLCLSLGLYQAYIQFAVGLFLLCMLQDCLQGKNEWKTYITQGLTAVAALLLGGGLYAVSVKVVLAYKHLELVDSNNGLQQMARGSVTGYLAKIPGAYAQTIQTLLGSSAWNHRGMRVATALCFLVGLFCLIRAFAKLPRRGIVQAVVLLALLPLGLNVVYLLSERAPTLLMLYPVYLLYLLVLLTVWQPAAPKAAENVVCVLCLFLALQNIIFANGAYTYRKFIYDNTRDQIYTIMAKVQELPEYVQGETPIAFVGDFTESDFAYRNALVDQYSDPELGLTNSALTYDGTRKWWFANVMGSNAVVVNTQAELDAYAALPAVQAMPSYPANGYIAMVDGTVVVKISD